MKTIKTSISIRYQPQLTALWALRELGSNAIDGEVRNRHVGIGKFSMTYRNCKLTLTNENVKVSSSALAHGTSESRGDEACIGTFGEGLPMALLVLARNSMEVTIVNGDEKWQPALERSSEFNGEPMLVIHRRKLPKDREQYSVSIEGVSEELHQEFIRQYLRFDSDLDPKMVIDVYSGERVLLQPKYNGMIYNKGVFVAHRKDLMFGYDLQAELNRDRTIMDEWTLKNTLGRLLSTATAKDNESFNNLLAESIADKNGVLEVSDEYSDLIYNGPFQPKVVEVFKAKYGDAIPVDNQSEVEEAKKLGLNAVVCNPVLRRIVSKKLGSLVDAKSKRNNSVVTTWQSSELSDLESYHFRLAVLAVQSVLPEAKDIQFTAVTFASGDVKYLPDLNIRTVHLAKDHLNSFETTLISTVKGSQALLGQSDPLPVLARIAAAVLTGQGSTSLAMALMSEIV